MNWFLGLNTKEDVDLNTSGYTEKLQKDVESFCEISDTDDTSGISISDSVVNKNNITDRTTSNELMDTTSTNLDEFSGELEGPVFNNSTEQKKPIKVLPSFKRTRYGLYNGVAPPFYHWSFYNFNLTQIQNRIPLEDCTDILSKLDELQKSSLPNKNIAQEIIENSSRNCKLLLDNIISQIEGYNIAIITINEDDMENYYDIIRILYNMNFYTKTENTNKEVIITIHSS